LWGAGKKDTGKEGYQEMSIAAPSERFNIGNYSFTSRLIIGTGKYRSYAEMNAAHHASGAEMVTVAVRRVPLDRSAESFLDHLDPALQILPNTAGCYSADEATRTARLAREALHTDLIKLEVIGDQTTLFPDNEQTLEAARVLVKEGFVVLPYFNDDLIMAKKLLDAGCPAVMPLAAPIGSGLGVQNPANLRIMREQLPDAIIIVDAGVGTASDATIAMELGADAVLLNTAIAAATDSEKMALSMKLAIQAGRLAYLAGRMPKRLYASASSPLAGTLR
jgi:thiazole synthase